MTNKEKHRMRIALRWLKRDIGLSEVARILKISDRRNAVNPTLYGLRDAADQGIIRTISDI